MLRKLVSLSIICIIQVVVTLSVDENDKRIFLIKEKLISPKDLPPPVPGVVDVAMILLNVNTNKTEQVKTKLETKKCSTDFDFRKPTSLSFTLLR